MLALEDQLLIVFPWSQGRGRAIQEQLLLILFLATGWVGTGVKGGREKKERMLILYHSCEKLSELGYQEEEQK